MSVLSLPKEHFGLDSKNPIKMLFSSWGLGMASESYFPEPGRSLAGTESKSLVASFDSFNAHVTGIFFFPFFKPILLKATLPATIRHNCINPLAH